MDKWDEIILNKIWDKIVNIFKREKKSKQYKLRIIKRNAWGFKVQRRYFGFFWLQIDSYQWRSQAEFFIKNYCYELKNKKYKKFLDKELKKADKKVFTIKCDCD